MILLLLMFLISGNLASGFFGKTQKFELFEKIWKISQSEVVIIADQSLLSDAKQWSKDLQMKSIPTFLFDSSTALLKAEKAIGERVCPVFTPFGSTKISSIKDQLSRNNAILPETKHKKSIFMAARAEGIPELLSLINTSLHFCPQKVDFGVMGANSNLFFILEDLELANAILASHPLRKHPSLHFIIMSKQKRPLFFCAMPCNGQRVLAGSAIAFVSTSFDSHLDSRISGALDLPVHFFHAELQGVGRAPGRPTDTSISKDYVHFVFQLQKILEQFLKFNASIKNPPEGTGSITAEGEFTGASQLLLHLEVDFTADMNSILLYSHQIADFTLPLEQHQVFRTFVTPPPKPRPKPLILLRPFEFTVWMGILLSLIFLPLVFVMAALVETHFMERKIGKFSKFSDATWYCLGTLCGESIQRRETYQQSNALRWMILLWLLVCLVLTTGYGGALYSFMSRPGMLAPIETLEQAVDSNLPSIYITYHTVHDVNIRRCRNGHLAKLIRESREMSYLDFPNYLQLLRGVNRHKSILMGQSSDILEDIMTIQMVTGGKFLVHWTDINLGVFPPTFMTIALPKLSPYGGRYKEIIGILLSSGVVRQEERRMLRRKAWNYHQLGFRLKPDFETNDGYEIFTLSDFYVMGHMLFMAIFYTLGLFSLLIEHELERDNSEENLGSNEDSSKEVEEDAQDFNGCTANPRESTD